MKLDTLQMRNRDEALNKTGLAAIVIYHIVM